jgi:hypothetical protein
VSTDVRAPSRQSDMSYLATPRERRRRTPHTAPSSVGVRYADYVARIRRRGGEVMTAVVCAHRACEVHASKACQYVFELAEFSAAVSDVLR